MIESPAIGALEFNSIAKGIESADAMVKAANVEIFSSRSICPGKYLTLLSGEVSAVNAAIAAGKETARGFVVDEFVIPNVHADIFPAVTGTAEVEKIAAVGVLETYSALTGILAGDAAAKAAVVSLMEIRIANGIGGKAVLVLTGDVAAVEASIKAGIEAIAHTGLYVSSVVIPAPHSHLKKFLS